MSGFRSQVSDLSSQLSVGPRFHVPAPSSQFLSHSSQHSGLRCPSSKFLGPRSQVSGPRWSLPRSLVSYYSDFFFYMKMEVMRETEFGAFFRNFHAILFFHAHFFFSFYNRVLRKKLPSFCTFFFLFSPIEFGFHQLKTIFFSRKGTDFSRRKKNTAIPDSFPGPRTWF